MKAIIDKQTNKCKGFGFIDFESHEDAQNAIAELQKKGYTAQLAKVFITKKNSSEVVFLLLNKFHPFLVISTTRTR